ncbi:TNF10 factor, partial [Oenanthe oenanthe]|nr:TNF10 factor [Oenanthe oenanthe]
FPSQLRPQAPGSAEELRCLQMLNQQPEGSSLEELSSSQGCLKLASTIKTYVATVSPGPGRTGELLVCLGHSLSTVPPAGHPPRPGNLSQSCRHSLRHWGHGGLRSHLHNMSYGAGRLRVEQPGKYYVYSQIYFRYPGAGGDSGPQLVQCIQRQPAHEPPLLLLKGVGTKCWAPAAEFGLQALYQGGLFELRAGDELFVSVSSLAIDSHDAAATYFGAFRLEM